MRKTPEWGDEQVEVDASAAIAEAEASGGAAGVAGETRSLWYFIRRSGKRIAVAVGGTLLIAAGIAMLVLPGPGWITIFAGLALLATEFAWAERLLHKAKRKAEEAKDAVLGKKAARDQRKADKARAKASQNTVPPMIDAVPTDPPSDPGGTPSLASGADDEPPAT